jgi:hypothetical protein
MPSVIAQIELNSPSNKSCETWLRCCKVHLCVATKLDSGLAEERLRAFIARIGSARFNPTHFFPFNSLLRRSLRALIASRLWR